jgi:hypothetical protein
LTHPVRPGGMLTVALAPGTFTKEVEFVENGTSSVLVTLHWHSGGNAAPVCDGTGRGQKPVHDGRLFGKQCPLLAGDGGPSNAGENNGRSSATLPQRRWRISRRSQQTGMSGDF